MQAYTFTPEDLEQIKAKNISKTTVEKQLRRFEKGYSFLNVLKAADDTCGIKSLSQDELNTYLDKWSLLLKDPKSEVVKFVPASGAASRMFKDLFKFFADGSDNLDTAPPSVKELLDNLSNFAFGDTLNRVCLVNNWKTMTKLYQQGEYKAIIENLIEAKGLNYGHLPKALIPFHTYSEGTRTAMEEHLAEGALYAKNISGRVKLHFTISPDHIDPFKSLLMKKTEKWEDFFSVHYDVTYSIQKPETDTIAVDMDNNPLREKDGSLIFRPGGHGALIRNLNDIDADVIFIKNIDNVVPDRYKSETIIYKKALGGYLISLRDKVYEYMRILNDEKRKAIVVPEIRAFLHKAFAIETPGLEGRPHAECIEPLRKILNRPIRVCGMVRNESEPGGGPYLVRNDDGTTSLQILESTQINMNDPAMREIFDNGKYFNPVDIVCCVRDYKGKKFNLTAFVNEETGFISYKSKDGKELKALELPGLWNGAMSEWNTAFVEVPASTFQPVKVVNDLLRPAHR
ncbi:DUF4301 family protein [Porphyromonas sp.]|uniref:DUF4301 family protein n=1 Tax=Porphyromonas sp. TaxID=1924944 RepID=UPI0026DC4F34|nr:DUF4301 family protein [Porphyromonas sp.]MDO4770736.1 DUF4301 family protein [Porphyromonas sp.]